MERRRLAAMTALLGSLVALSSCGKPDVYPLNTAEAYRLLSAAELEPSDDGVFIRLETSVSGNSADEVTWAASDAYVAYACRLALKRVDAAHTHVAVNCEGGSPTSGAAEHNLVRNRVIEMVDATLTGRAFDPQLADGTTAWRWPGDGPDGSLANAAAEAIKLDAEKRGGTGDAPAMAELPDSDDLVVPAGQAMPAGQGMSADPAPAAEDVTPEP